MRMRMRMRMKMTLAPLKPFNIVVWCECFQDTIPTITILGKMITC